MPTTIERPRDHAYVGAYVPPSMRAEFEQLAEQNYHSLSAELRIAIARHLEASADHATAQAR